MVNNIASYGSNTQRIKNPDPKDPKVPKNRVLEPCAFDQTKNSTRLPAIQTITHSWASVPRFYVEQFSLVKAVDIHTHTHVHTHTNISIS